MIPGYAELHCLTNYTFLRGASDPEELVRRATRLGYRALAITDECSVAGIVRAHTAAKEVGLKLIIGTEITLVDGLKLVLLATHIRGYETMCELITTGRRAAPKGEYRLSREDIPAAPEGLQALWLPGKLVSETNFPARCTPIGKLVSDTSFCEAEWVAKTFPGNAWIAIELHRGPDDARRVETLEAIGAKLGITCVAAGDVHMHERTRKKLQDVMTAIRHKCPLAEVGTKLQPNAERYARSIGRLSAIYPPRLLATTLDLAARCAFSLDEIRYEYPEELVPAGETPATHLKALALEGLARRYPHGAPEEVARTVEHELRLIEELAYEP